MYVLQIQIKVLLPYHTIKSLILYNLQRILLQVTFSSFCSTFFQRISSCALQLVRDVGLALVGDPAVAQHPLAADLPLQRNGQRNGERRLEAADLRSRQHPDVAGAGSRSL